MSRGTIEFIQSQQVAWQPHPLLPNVTYKTLSQAANTGEEQGMTALYTFPVNWRYNEAFSLDGDEELFVLHGEFWINGVLHREGSYAYLPKHFQREELRCSKEALVIRFLSGADKPNKTSIDDNSDGGFCKVNPKTLVILGKDTIDIPWDHTLADGNLKHLCASRKILRIDPLTKAKTFLYSVLPQTFPVNNKGKQEYHPTVEEALVLTGDLIGPHGAMRTGAYFWREPMIPHGPFGSRTGCTCLIRFVGGEHVNYWTESEEGFSFEAPYKPLLPEALSTLAKTPVDLAIKF